MAKSITLGGQLSIKWIEKRINDYLGKLLGEKDRIILSDTDSIYITLDDLVNKVYGDTKPDIPEIVKFIDKVCEEKLTPFINKAYAELAEYVNARTNCMVMKRESIASVGLIRAKKNYCLSVYNSEGVAFTEPYLKIMGLEVVRSSTPQICRDKLKEAIKIILNKDKAGIVSFVDKFREEFFKASPEDIAFPRGVNNLAKYATVMKGVPMHVRGALTFNKLLKSNGLEKKYPEINEGEKIKFLYLKQPNPIRDYAIAFINTFPKEFELLPYVDYETQFQKSFLDPLNSLLIPIGWTYENTNTLDEFFG